MRRMLVPLVFVVVVAAAGILGTTLPASADITTTPFKNLEECSANKL